MKINGREPTGPNRDFVIIPRGGKDEDYVFWVQAVETMDEFDKYCPAPVPPQRIVAGGKRVTDFEDKEYLSQLDLYAKRRLIYLVLKSLDLPENQIEWETIDLTKPRTWLNLEDELRGAHFSAKEIDRIIEGALAVNSLSEAKMREARNAFLQGLAEVQVTTAGQNTEPDSTKSGEPASDSE